VLPFENLSQNPDSAFFADGVQEEILTDLARIADLKVISRTSVMQYKSGVPRDLSKIGHELGVANVLEGSVQRDGNRVRVNAHLVDARSHRDLWGQSYDRDLADVFAIQSEIAMAIADQLHAKLSPNEKSEIERPATSDITALSLYTHAQNLLLTSFSSAARAKLLKAVDLLNEAVARDPSFFQAYCRLSQIHDQLYLLGVDHTPARLALAEGAIQQAFRFVQMQVKRTSRARKIFTRDTSIMTVPWRNWNLPGNFCPMIRGYSILPVSSRGVRATGKNQHETLSAQLISIRATFSRSSRLRLATDFSGVTLKK